MQTKSEMINRIAELAKENAELKEEVKQWKHEYEMLDACIELEQGKMSELKAENERLKEQVKELSHYLACMTEQRNKANTCLQQIKEKAEKHTHFSAYASVAGYEDILKLINKTEEE